VLGVSQEHDVTAACGSEGPHRLPRSPAEGQSQPPP
jgi:hypothetical protein